MAEPTEPTVNENKAPETTAPANFIMPNQHLIEQVIDLRLAAHAKAEKPAAKTTRASAKDADKS